MATKFKKILVVEDEKDLRELIATLLADNGYETFSAADGEEGLKIAKDILPDLVICDVMMPNLDGNQMIKKLRESYFGKNIPVIVLSARSGMKDYFSVLGVDAFIEKPFAKADLLAQVNKIFAEPKKEKNPGDPKRILIIGSQADAVEKIAADLRGQGCHVDFVLSGEQGISKAVLFLPNIIILQNDIPEIGPQEIIKILRRMPQFKKMPILIFSALSATAAHSKEDHQQKELNDAVMTRRCLDEGATEYAGRLNEPLFMEKILKFTKKGAIAVIDDDAGLVQLLRAALEKEGYKVFAARDGTAGLALVRDMKPGLVVLDIIMPSMDGYETLFKLKEDPLTKEIPVIMLTVKSQEHEIQKGLDLGADDYIIKPVTTNLLLRRIKTLIKEA